ICRIQSTVSDPEAVEMLTPASPNFLHENATCEQCTAYRPTTSRIFAYSSDAERNALRRVGTL
ncbi:hypothetical protein KEM55_003321, partial [Ascosphaera atra]